MILKPTSPIRLVLHSTHRQPKMASFITTPSTIRPFRINKPSARCTLNKRIYPHASRTNPIMQTRNFSPNDEMDDSDDDSLGSIPDTSGLGIHVPSLTPSEQIYLDGAKDSKEYVTRMTEIARKKEEERETLKSTKQSQTPDDYIESLARKDENQVLGDHGGPRIDATEEYMENLSRMYRQNQGIEDSPLPEDRRSRTAPAGPVVNPSLIAEPDDSVAELEDKVRAIEKEISEVSQSQSQSEEESIAAEVMAELSEMAGLQETDITADDEEDAVDMTLEEGARKIAELQRQIREAAGLEEEEEDPFSEPETPQITNTTEPESDPMPKTSSEATIDTGSLRQSHVGNDPGTVEKQIEFLESYLSRLEQEASEDPAADEETAAEMQAAMSTLADEVGKMPTERSAIQGIETTPGGMTAEEKVAIFEELRRRASEQQPSEEFADPLNVTLPERKSDTELGDSGDAPSLASEAEYDSFDSSAGDKSLLIEEIESEIKAYTRDVKNLLRKHETRLQVLLARLRML